MFISWEIFFFITAVLWLLLRGWFLDGCILMVAKFKQAQINGYFAIFKQAMINGYFDSFKQAKINGYLFFI